jgi:hypothetical protein
MKLTREQITEQGLRIYLDEEKSTAEGTAFSKGARFVKFPEFVDTELGEVHMWVIPTEPREVLLAETKIDTITQPPEIEGYAFLKKVKGKITII